MHKTSHSGSLKTYFKYETLKQLVLLALALTLFVIVLGAYTRLKDAGLGCPDWPGCYGHLIVPSNAVAPEVETQKAWIEMIHRYVAGTLGLLILAVTLLTFMVRANTKVKLLATLLLALVVFQALLGMWTVTLRLYPIVVMGHLLGGFAILALLWLLFLYLRGAKPLFAHKHIQAVKNLALISTVAIIAQIALGGWTSATYSALVCADFPTCQGHWWPHMDWAHAFNLTGVGILHSPGQPLHNAARVTIQMAHRLGALLIALLVLSLCYKLLQSKIKLSREIAGAVLFLLGLQVTLGILNVLFGLPVIVSLLHTLTAALILLSLIYITFNLYAAKPTHK